MDSLIRNRFDVYEDQNMCNRIFLIEDKNFKWFVPIDEHQEKQYFYQNRIMIEQEHIVEYFKCLVQSFLLQMNLIR